MRAARRVGGACAAVFAVAACSTEPAPEVQLAPFTSDGCSMFPDRSLTRDDVDWCLCCAQHDVAYWRGGTRAERKTADEQLRACVEQTTGDASLAQTMYLGVRAGGAAGVPTGYRWGYGWPFGRGYEALTQAEQTRAAALLDEAPPLASFCVVAESEEGD